MPQSKEVRETQVSSRPGLMKLFIISFARDAGCSQSGFSSYSLMMRSAYLLRRKKYASSSASTTGRPQSGHLPSTSWVSVQNDSHGLQYLPL